MDTSLRMLAKMEMMRVHVVLYNGKYNFDFCFIVQLMLHVSFFIFIAFFLVYLFSFILHQQLRVVLFLFLYFKIKVTRYIRFLFLPSSSP
jgi:hypothetical protein